MDIQIQLTTSEQRRPKPTSESDLDFGKSYSDHMFTMQWHRGKGWHDAKIIPFQNLGISPAALVLHYSQTIFEGLKAYRGPQGEVNLFRPQENCNRFNKSAARLDLPHIDEDLMLKAIETLVGLDADWIPQYPNTSLYVRPTMIGVEPYIGIKSADQVLFYIITSPVGPYYKEGFNPVKIQVSQDFCRAAPKGLGAAKTGPNYAASLLAEKNAQQAGYTQVLWLDAREQCYIEEVGTMNILFKIGGKVITPPLGDTILAGITRDSVLALLRSWGESVEERPLAIDELVEAHANNRVEEVFGAGTAAVISPVGVLEYKDKVYAIGNGSAGPLASRLYAELTGIQYGLKEDPFAWRYLVATARA